MARADELDRGRESFERHEWGDSYARLSSVGRRTPLHPEDLERLATAAFLIGKDPDSDEAWARAHREWVRHGDAPRAARCAFWLAFALLNRGEMARGSGWLSRAQRLVDEKECVERGFLLLPAAIGAFEEGDPAAAHGLFAQAEEIGSRFGNWDVVTMARLGRGRALVVMGRLAEGVALLDEAMVAVTAGEVSPIVIGDVYCSVIEACRDTFDLRRAQEWTAALTRLCESEPDLVPYRGRCLVYRAEIMQLHGAWPEAVAEARQACELLSDPPGQPAAGAAFYQLAELHRVRGEHAEAELAYRQASDLGRMPQPGLAQLRLSQGQVEAAGVAIRIALDGARDRFIRSSLLAVHVEVALAAGDVQTARGSADKLAGTVAYLDVPFLRAVSAHATGAVVLAEGGAGAALALLREAWTAWNKLDAPYEAARARVLIALACRDLGDVDGCQMELDAARRAFAHLGATPDLAWVEGLLAPATPSPAGGLTGREVEVLRLVAAGKSNRAIAEDLVISEKTVARHVSNIFTKLGLSSRAAATAHAYKHGLV